MKRVIILFVVAFILDGTARAQIMPDTVPYATFRPEEKFNWKQLILPGTLIAVGSFGVKNGWFHRVNHDVNHELKDISDGNHCHIDDYLQYSTAVAFMGVQFIPGVKSKHTFVEKVCVEATAYALTAIMVNTTKYTVREKRPDSGERNAFPSGHTACAFTGAELMRIEYGNAMGLGAYAFAFTVGFLRLYNERHSLNDVLAGAGIGILNARLAYWLLPLERRLFHINPKSQQQVMLAPYLSPDQACGLSLAMTF